MIWIQTFTGKKFTPFEPRIADVDIHDIAHALANKCRFGGHTRHFYSVAQHSVIVARLLPPALRKWGLLHDAAEAYLCDVPSPIKPRLQGFRELEERVLNCVSAAFGLEWPYPPEVKERDLDVLWAEAEQLLVLGPRDWSMAPRPRVAGLIAPLDQADAERLFLSTWKLLCSGVKA